MTTQMGFWLKRRLESYLKEAVSSFLFDEKSFLLTLPLYSYSVYANLTFWIPRMSCSKDSLNNQSPQNREHFAT